MYAFSYIFLHQEKMRLRAGLSSLKVYLSLSFQFCVYDFRTPANLSAIILLVKKVIFFFFFLSIYFTGTL